MYTSLCSIFHAHFSAQPRPSHQHTDPSTHRVTKHVIELCDAKSRNNAIVVVRIMAGRDHDAAVEVIHAGDVSHRRRSGDVEQISVRAGSGQTSHQAVLEHIRTAAGN